jgi:lipoyl(octanoyl) transferase
MAPFSRIIDDAHHDAAFNMAADLHLLSLCEQAPAVFVRIYSWEKPSITLGMTEKPTETLDLAAIAAHGVEWIRRPTGGRSVLHDHDITYSCVFSVGVEGFGATLIETYSVISRCLLNGLEKAGIRCGAHDSPPDSHLSRSNTRLPCFLSPNRHEIMAGGKKLLGSAQKRSAKAVLQHGSIPLTPAFRLLPDYLVLSEKERDAQKRMLARKTACVSEVLPGYDAVSVKRCLIDGFKGVLPFPLIEQDWSVRELADISRVSENAAFLLKWHALAGRENA